MKKQIERQIQGYDNNVCRHPEHDPVTHKVREPGKYEHECPGCGNIQVFEIELVTL